MKLDVIDSSIVEVIEEVIEEFEASAKAYENYDIPAASGMKYVADNCANTLKDWINAWLENHDEPLLGEGR